MTTITDVKIWKNPAKTETRVYVHAGDGREGCKYLTGNHFHPRGEVEGELTPQEWTEARRIAVWDGHWHTVYQNPATDGRRDEANQGPRNRPELSLDGRQLITLARRGQEGRNRGDSMTTTWMCNECGEIRRTQSHYPQRRCMCGSISWIELHLTRVRGVRTWATTVAEARRERAEWAGYWDRHSGMGNR